MQPGLEPGASHSETEAVAGLTELAAGFPSDGLWTLVALLEHAARKWMTLFMEPGEQSVGARVTIRRTSMRPAAIVTSTATLRELRGRRYIFDVELHDEQGELLASGTNERAVISVA
jgi:predicted thioesterase